MSHSRSGGTVRSRRVVTPAVELPGPLGSARVRQGLVVGMVAGQVALVLLVLLPVGPVLWAGRDTLGWVLTVTGLVVGALGLLALGKDTRVSPVPPSGGRLHRNGVYAFVRHPMYLGLGLFALGVTVVTGRLLALVGFVLLAVLLVVKARIEDHVLQRKFGWEYAIYAMRVPSIVPQPWRSHRR